MSRIGWNNSVRTASKKDGPVTRKRHTRSQSRDPTVFNEIIEEASSSRRKRNRVTRSGKENSISTKSSSKASKTPRGAKKLMNRFGFVKKSPIPEETNKEEEKLIQEVLDDAMNTSVLEDIENELRNSAPDSMDDILARTEFDDTHTQECKELINRRGPRIPKGYKGDKKRIEVQRERISLLKECLKTTIARKKAFIEQMRVFESKVVTEAQRFREQFERESKLRAHVTGKLEKVEGKAQKAQENLASFSAKNEAWQEDKARLEEEHSELSKKLITIEEEYKQVTLEMAGLKVELKAESDKLATKLVEHQREIDSLNSGFEREREQFSREKNEFYERLDETMKKLEVSQENASKLEALLKEKEVELVTAKAEMSANTGRSAEAQNKISSMEQEVSDLKDKLAAKDTEVSKAVASFASAQQFNQERIMTLTNQCSELQAKLAEMAELKASLSETGTQFAAEIKSLEKDVAIANASLEKAQAEIGTLQSERNKLQQEKASLEFTLEKAEQELEKKEEENKDLVSQMEANNATLKAMDEKNRTDNEAALRLQVAMETEIRMIRDQWIQQKSELDGKLKCSQEAFEQCTKEKMDARHEVNCLQKELDTIKANNGASQEAQLQNLCKLSVEAEELRRQVQEKQTLIKNVADANKLIAELRQEIFNGETNRRKLHNTIQELRGNIRVYTRVRPFLPHDNVGPEESMSMSFGRDQQSIILRNTRGDKPHKFNFDHVFGPKKTQEQVFNDVSELVQSALDGYNVCLFSYGQTGSGKTHTMQGGEGKNRGIIPRSIQKVLEQAVRLESQGWKYSIQVSFCEIYREKIRDLLCNDSANSDLDVKQCVNDPLSSTSVHVPGLTKVDIMMPTELNVGGRQDQSSTQIAALLSRANRNRAAAATDMNAHSSRSHLVFTLYLTGENQDMDTRLLGTLNLCDLAGSERLARSGATGERMKETQAINKSLSCLSDIFMSLGTKGAHVPYRNSKLTYLLKDCFSNNGKTMMMVNLSPTMQSQHETLCSLRFAAKVNKCQLGTAKKTIRGLDEGKSSSSSSSSSSLSSRGNKRKSASSSRQVTETTGKRTKKARKSASARQAW